ncbi:MAG TPA: CHASE2 domain-containing protein, partial [Myxococcaceae bacterium]|nr:CHASE2 domain-containing protein [Myxococcaceae bacterium]
MVQAAVLASIFGGLAYFRLGHEREDEDASPSPLRALRREAEKLELATYDWRARDLGDSSEPSDDVVVVAVDDQTLANARLSDQQGAALRPWPRELTGGLVGELVKEGSPLVVVDLAFPDLSPRACTGIAPVPPGGVSDDALLLDDDGRFRGVLDSVAGKSILGFDWTESPAPPAAPHLTPYGLRVATPRSVDEELPLAGRILSDRKRLFAIPDGRRVQLWAGASSEEECSALAEMWRLKGPPQIRALTPADMDRPVSAEDLLLLLSEVHVEGLDPSQLTRAEQLEPPIPALLGASSRYGGLTLPRDLDGQVRGFPHLVAYRAGGDGPRRDQPLHVLPSAPLA